MNELSFSVADGEFVVLVGPSGCGKTTALRMVAGLEEITDGEIRDRRRASSTTSPRSERDIAMVFQNYALYPHMTVCDNMAFGLKMRGVAKARDRAARRARRRASLGLERRCWTASRAQLSGGQRQRVAMGRAIVREPRPS